jgi:hypothetical protein
MIYTSGHNAGLTENEREEGRVVFKCNPSKSRDRARRDHEQR